MIGSADRRAAEGAAAGAAAGRAGRRALAFADGRRALGAMLVFALGVALGLLPASLLAAAFIDPAAARFQRLDAEEGLSQSSIQALAQDSEGRIWIGTLNGLNRFDGYENHVFRPRGEGDGEVADNYITSLLAEAHGQMWVGTLEGISRWEPERERFRNFRIDPQKPEGLLSNMILALHRDAAGRLWAGTERGLARWDPVGDRFLHWPPGGDPAAGLPDPRVTAIASAADGRLWVGTSGGPALYDVEAASLLPMADFPQRGAPVTSMAMASDGRLFVGLDKRGVVLGGADGRGWRELPVGEGSRALGSRLVRSVFVDRRGVLWVGSEDGLDGALLDGNELVETVRYRSNRLSRAGLGGGVVAALLEDREGTLWIGSWNQGVNWLSPDNNLFSSYTAETAATLDFRNPASIGLATWEQVLWIGSGSGLWGFDTAQRRLWEVSPGQDFQTYYSGEVVGERLWFGHALGLRMLDPRSGAYQDRSLSGKLGEGRLRRLLVDEDRVWAAVDPFGVVLLDLDLSEVRAQHAIPRSITFVEPFDERFVLVGSYDGLYWFDARSGAFIYRHELGSGVDPEADSPARLPLAPMDFVRGGDGRSWLATNGAGLAELVLQGEQPSAARFRMLDERAGLADGALKAIERDAEGRLWISTASGISSFDPRQGVFRNYYRGDGTLGRDYINAASATFADGQLVFGGMDGFTLFDPGELAEARGGAPPVPLISGLEADGRGFLVGRGLGGESGEPPVLLQKGGVRSLSVRFASTEYVDARRIAYRYRLDPLDSEWTEVRADRRLASYTGLAPGSYRLRLQASNDGRSWSEERSLDLSVPPFWWQTLWARLGVLLLVLAALFSAHRLRLARVAQRNEWLSAQVAERTRELDQRTHALEESRDSAQQALQRLEATQQELLRSEKMAALGGLVAGVAHEVNTPLGVALTASSVLREASGRLGAQVTAGQVRRSDFDRFLTTVSESTSMIERNLERAAQLIANFKQVSVDRTSDGRREFDLAGYLEEVLESLRLLWKQRSIIMEIDCPAGIVLNSFPGAIGQIITNLTQNAVLHGFREAQGGRMRISGRVLDSGEIELRLGDDGVGMPEQILERIFDPFFTTRRNQGGTGLGLHIVYNLVTHKLGGRIQVRSRPGEGSDFIIQLPRRAPD